MGTYEEMRQARIDRMRTRADQKEAESERLERHIHTIAGALNGQPILSGHHSEKQHRRELERMHRDMRKSIDLRKEAWNLRRRAKAAETDHIISSNDPNAVEKIHARIVELEERQTIMKTINKEWRWQGKPKHDNVEAWNRIAEIQELSDETVADICHAMALCPWHTAPYPPYALQNNSNNIRRLQQRIVDIERERSIPIDDMSHIGYNTETGINLCENLEFSGIELYFQSKPNEDTISHLKLHGWRWSRRNRCWYHRKTAAAVEFAQALVKGDSISEVE